MKTLTVGKQKQIAVNLRAKDALREEWNAMLVQTVELKAMRGHNPDGDKWLDAGDANVRTLLAAMDAPKFAGIPFVCRFSSVGNPDFGQYHGEGEGSPTFTVSAPDLLTLVKIQQAYVSVYDLGGGNCPEYKVYRDGAQVARISYNGRVWTPFQFGDPRCVEIVIEEGA